MDIILNDTPRSLSHEMSIAEMLSTLNYPLDKVAVAVEGEFIPRSQHSVFLIQSGQTIEVVAPMQGG
jgi:sulfur carrier protein